jgi:hypothetical protein
LLHPGYNRREAVERDRSDMTIKAAYPATIA